MLSARRDDGLSARSIRDGVIALGPVDSDADLPTGWRDDQEPGRYRATSTGDRTRFQYAATAQPWKRFVHPERALLIRSRRTGRSIAIDDDPAGEQALAFVGIRSCDLVALHRLDVVLGSDAGYRQRRTDLAIVAVACTAPAATCFCAAAGTGPRPGPDADVVLTELDDGTLLATAQTELGHELIASCTGAEAATPSELAHAGALIDGCASSQTRHLDSADIGRAAAQLDHAGWNDVAERCLTCGNCTMVCPTCFCTSVEDRTSVADDSVERWQRWDSCFSLDFSHVHGGSVRTSASSRYRQWYTHKLVTWHDQFGSSGCVGCGRCITWCPTGIDITAGGHPMSAASSERGDAEAIAGELRTHPLFGALVAEFRDLVAECASPTAFAAGERLLSAGDPADHFWLIGSGRVDVEIHGSAHGTLTIQRLGPGDLVGVSWIAPPFRSEFDATAKEAGRGLRFDARCLRTKCSDEPALGHELYRGFAGLLRDRLHATRLQLLDLYEGH